MVKKRDASTEKEGKAVSHPRLDLVKGSKRSRRGRDVHPELSEDNSGGSHSKKGTWGRKKRIQVSREFDELSSSRERELEDSPFSGHVPGHQNRVEKRGR